MFTLHLQKTWERRTQAEFFGIGGIDSSNHGLRHAIEGFFSESARYETRQRFVLTAVQLRTWQNEIGSHPQFSECAKDVGRDEWPQP